MLVRLRPRLLTDKSLRVDVPTSECHHVGMTSKARQYTIRNVPASVDRALRRKAVERRVSLNSLLLSALDAEVGGAVPRLQHDLDGFFGTWISDAKVDRALAEVRRVDPRDWDD